MKEGWEVKKLDDIIESNVIGLTKNSNEQDINYNFKYVKMNNITRDNCFDLSKYTCVNAEKEEVEKYSLSEGDLLFNTRNSYELVGKTCLFKGYNDEVILYNNNIMRIRFVKNINPSFINYAFSTNELIKKIDLLKSGTTNVSAIYYKDLKNLELFVPPLTEQKRIVAILEQAFEAIAKAKANAEQNLKNAKELFESYLNEIFENKGEGWEEKKLGEVIEIKNGRNQKAVLDENGKYPILGSAGSVMGYANDYICKEGTTIIGRKGNISKPIYIEQKFWSVDTAFGLYPLGQMPTRFVYYTCLNIDFEKLNRGTTIPSLVKSELLTIPLLIPKSIEQQNQIVEKLDKLRAETQKLEAIYKQKIEDLEELKKSILQKAFAGELKTDDIAV